MFPVIYKFISKMIQWHPQHSYQGKQELSQLRQFATNFLRNRNNYGVTFAPNQTDWTSVLANDWQSGHKNSLRRPPLLKTRKSDFIIFSFHVQFHLFLSIIWSIKEFSHSGSQCHVSKKKKFHHCHVEG